MSEIFDAFGSGSGVITVILLILVVFLMFRSLSCSMRLTRLEKKYKMFMKGSDAQSLEKAFTRKLNQIDRLYEAKEDHEHAIDFLKKKRSKSLSIELWSNSLHSCNPFSLVIQKVIPPVARWQEFQ